MTGRAPSGTGTPLAEDHTVHTRRRVIAAAGATGMLALAALGWKIWPSDESSATTGITIVAAASPQASALAPASPPPARETDRPRTDLEGLSIIERQLLVRSRPSEKQQADLLLGQLTRQFRMLGKSVSIDAVLCADHICEVAGFVDIGKFIDQEDAVTWLKGQNLRLAFAGAGLSDVTEISINRGEDNDLAFVVHGQL